MEKFILDTPERNQEKTKEETLNEDFVKLPYDVQHAIRFSAKGDIDFLMNLRNASGGVEVFPDNFDEGELYDDEGEIIEEKLDAGLKYKIALYTAYSVSKENMSQYFKKIGCKISPQTIDKIRKVIEKNKIEFNGEIDPETVNEDEMRKTIAKRYGLPETALWEEIVAARDNADSKE